MIKVLYLSELAKLSNLLDNGNTFKSVLYLSELAKLSNGVKPNQINDYVLYLSELAKLSNRRSLRHSKKQFCIFLN